MLDNLQFTKTTLSNGIDCFVNPMPLDFTVIYIRVPVGSANSVDPFLPGTFHFLEHICCDRSRVYPEPHGFDLAVGLTGGWANAHTSRYATVYELSVPNKHLPELLEGYFARVFEPVWDEAGWETQRSIIRSERQRRERWYPGSSEIGQYEMTKWKWTEAYPLEQSLGSDADLAAMSVPLLQKAHAAYADPRTMMMVMGNGDISTLSHRMESLSVTKQDLPWRDQPIRWVNREYHVASFRDIRRNLLTIGGFVQPMPGVETVRQLRFILSYLLNTTHGALYEWLRYDLGWSYDLSSNSDVAFDYFDWDITLPLQTMAQVEHVKHEWRGKAEQALAQQTGIDKEVDRLLGASAYWNISPEPMLNSAFDHWDTYGRIVSDTEWRELIESCRNRQKLQQLFDQYFAEGEIGIYCAVPEEAGG
jgi:predicted Zn-dependent peptidase